MAWSQCAGEYTDSKCVRAVITLEYLVIAGKAAVVASTSATFGRHDDGGGLKCGPILDHGDGEYLQMFGHIGHIRDGGSYIEFDDGVTWTRRPSPPTEAPTRMRRLLESGQANEPYAKAARNE